MGSQTAFTAFLLLLGLTHGSVDVKMSGGWQENSGWELTCSWAMDRRPLQSVRLYVDDVQFMIYRPEKQGAKHDYESYTNDTRIAVDCQDLGRTGRCVVRLQLLAAPVFATQYKCEVSEEGPRFEMKQAEYSVEIFVPSTHPQLEVSAVESLTNVNCSSAGIPAPRLVWRVGDVRIPENFSSRRWDATTKLWHSWSVVTVPPPREPSVLTCAVLSATAGNAESHSIEVTINSAGCFTGQRILLAVLSLIALLR